jgi:hypothetical protein
MYDVKSLVVLLKLYVVTLIGSAWAWKRYWPELPPEGAVTLFVTGCLCGAFYVAAYMLIRYRRELTPARGEQ